MAQDAAVEHEQQLRSLLRQYEQILRDCYDGKTQQAGELDERLGTLLEMQGEREETFDWRLSQPPREEWGFWGVDNSALEGKLHILRSQVIPDFPELRKHNEPFVEERRFRDYAIARIEAELRNRGVPVEKPKPPEVNPAERLSAAWRSKKEAVLKLERERDEELRTSSKEMHPYIKKIFRKAIDSILES